MTKISTTDDLTKQSRRSGAGPSPSSLILSDSLHPDAEPGRDCPLCPRLVEFRSLNRTQHPDWFNAPVPTFGPRDARLLVIGLAPGLQGANRTGRPFTGDFAGDLLFATLGTYGFARGDYRAQPDDGRHRPVSRRVRLGAWRRSRPPGRAKCGFRNAMRSPSGRREMPNGRPGVAPGRRQGRVPAGPPERKSRTGK